MTNTPKYIIVHCSDVSYKDIPDQFNSINKYHQQRGFLRSSLGNYVGYHRLITGSKNYECKKDWEEGCHTNQVENGISINLQSLGICIGFDGDKEYPLDYMYKMVGDQIHAWMRQYSIPVENVKMHRHFNTAKTCPGSLITDAYLAQLLKSIIPPEPTKPSEQQDKQTAILSTEQQNNLRYAIIQAASQAVVLLRQLLGMNNKV